MFYRIILATWTCISCTDVSHDDKLTLAGKNTLGQRDPVPRRSAPRGVEVTVAALSGEEVVFTSGSYTVRFEGPARTFAESANGITNTVHTTTWVRLLPAPFDGRVDSFEWGWIEEGVAANTRGELDVLATAYQYIAGSPDVFMDGLRVAGDAAYGSDTGADFNDFLRIEWSYEGKVDSWDAIDAGNLDCSGYARMVFGYRGGIPMSLSPDDETTLPRKTSDLLAAGTGSITIPHVPGQPVSPSQLGRLAPGDLVFFDSHDDDGVIDHTGIFLGVDTAGNHRMINSRNSMAGPTMRDGAGSAYGESGSPSIVNGTSLYGRTFRAARRL